MAELEKQFNQMLHILRNNEPEKARNDKDEYWSKTKLSSSDRKEKRILCDAL